MSVISRFICSSPRLSLVKPTIQRGFIRHFQAKSKPTIEKKPFKVEPEQLSSVESHGTHGTPSLAKYYIYAAVFVPSTFVGCMIWQYENFRNKARAVRIQRNYANKEFGFRDHLNGLWNQFTPGKKMIVGIIAANTLVFGLWKVPALSSALSRYFLCFPIKGVSVLGATLSGFSHVSGFHLLANMYVLWSFSNGCLHMMNYEQLLAVYLSGITISSLLSATYRVLSKRMIPSLGASGGILSLIAVVCYSMPDSRISIAFVDQIIPHSFSAQSAIFGIMALDVLGLIMRWRLFDHAGHLGGVLFGLLYASYGKTAIWENSRRDVLKWWHTRRNKPKES